MELAYVGTGASRTRSYVGLAFSRTLRRVGMDRMPPLAAVYVLAVIVGGVLTLAAYVPTAFAQPMLLAVVVAAAFVTAAWKVNLPISLDSGSTLSVSFAAKLMALLLLGPGAGVLAGIAAALTQCTWRVKQPYPVYRTVFSMTAEAVSMAATAGAYAWFGGPFGPFDLRTLAAPLLAAIGTYFFVNTGLVAGAIALSSSRRFAHVWIHDFMWSGVTFLVAGSAGALAAVVIFRGDHWLAVLLLAPVYLTFRTYQIFMGRLADEQRHGAEMRRMRDDMADALAQTYTAERALAAEKERLAHALADMTRLEDARYQLLEREQAARASAEQANRLKDEFLAVVSHELRTPLNAILGWADMLRSGRLDEGRQGRAMQVIFDSARRQAQLIDDLLDVSRIISGKLRLERAPIDLADVVRQAVTALQTSAEAKRVRLDCHASSGTAIADADRSRLQQVVLNLLSNAIKFTPEGGSVTVSLHAAGEAAAIVVADTGEGIPADFLPDIFEPFRQADGSATRRHGGLGLGLSIVRHLVEAHGGTVTAHSDGPGRGARFTVRLPTVLAGGAGAVQPDATPAARRPRVSLKGISVLVVDDDFECRQVAAAHLAAHDASVVTAGSAAEAFEVLQHQRVDVLLADIAMPGEDGYSLIRRVRALPQSRVARIPAAAITAFARNEDHDRALRAGFQLHLAKPIEGDALVAAVARLRGALVERRQVAS